jgi:YD repeat-containing protein
MKAATTSDNGTVTPQTETFNSQNEIQTTMPAGVTSLYDANGNMVYIPLDNGSGDYYHAVYDAWNNMVGETLVGTDGNPISGSAAETAQYSYDGQGHRIAKAVQLGGGSWTRTDFYINAGGQVIEQDTGTNASQVGMTPSAQYIWSGSTPVCQMQYTNGSTLSRTLYYTTDADNNVTAVVDQASGKVVERYIYDPYGTVTFLDANWQPTVVTGAAVNGTASAYANTLLFGSCMFYAETKMEATQTRFDITWLGVFAGQDGVWSTNLYPYCRDNPSAGSDPSGQDMMYSVKPGETVPDWVDQSIFHVVTDWGAPSQAELMQGSIDRDRAYEEQQAQWFSNYGPGLLKDLVPQYAAGLVAAQQKSDKAQVRLNPYISDRLDIFYWIDVQVNMSQQYDVVGALQREVNAAEKELDAFPAEFDAKVRSSAAPDVAKAWAYARVNHLPFTTPQYQLDQWDSQCRQWAMSHEQGLESDMTPIFLMAMPMAWALDAPIAFGLTTAGRAGAGDAITSLSGLQPEDFATNYGQAVFYAGRDGLNQSAAMASGGTTISQTVGGRALDELVDWPSLTIEESRALATPYSRWFAEQASGPVRAWAGGASPDSVFLKTELPALLGNPNVTQVQIMDAINTARTTIIYTGR